MRDPKHLRRQLSTGKLAPGQQWRITTDEHDVAACLDTQDRRVAVRFFPGPLALTLDGVRVSGSNELDRPSQPLGDSSVIPFVRMKLPATIPCARVLALCRDVVE